MSYKLKLTTLLLLLVTLSACLSAPTERFDESFFTYQDDEGKKYFSFILKLKGMTSVSDKVVYERVAGRRSGRGSAGKRSIKQEVPRPENPEDAKVSIKFRMEEMAHEKLTDRLEAIDYCSNEIAYESEEYKNYQYRIKGYCLPEQDS
ncbi:hypothetical protein FLL45_14320 [Aliikangiella marina]|uniref:Lipoprotein n=1 Tax=Aliikangiella marina TaxID=1712262 RepID=A0A545T9Y9_9GAMM|nr:hypothetical protein [Aliikangiella marina]TQV74030.1 hypothetical protein FLL45_14320 [Aliikangiella marina]